MTISNDKLKLIKNNHLDSTEMLLDKLLKNADMSQAEFAKKVGKDASTVNRWIKNSRAIAFDNAVKIAEILNIHPVEIYQQQAQLKISEYMGADMIVHKYDKEDAHSVKVPFELMNDNTIGVQLAAPGFFLHGEVFLFEKNKFKSMRFDPDSINKLCYITPSAEAKKKYKHDCTTIVGKMHTNRKGKLSIFNPMTNEPINEYLEAVDQSDIEYCCPVKAKYYPDKLGFSNK
tara:strand:+ start:996 stop:1688 length:693 start_codon:yes stop_codon:yes gene_type:complete